MKREISSISHRPSTNDPDGSYKYVDADGIYWGHWYVGTNWCGQRFCCPADEDGLPW